MGVQLADRLKDDYYTRQSAVHDVHDSGGPYTLDTDYELYVNDAVTRDVSSVVMWDKTTNHIDCSMLALYCKLFVKVDSTVAAGNKGAVILVKFECPNGGSPFIVEEVQVEVPSNDAKPSQWKMLGYVGPEVKQYGIDIYSRVESGTANVSNRKLLVEA